MEIAEEYELNVDLESTNVVHEYVQQITTDWKFLEERAMLNGFEIWIDHDVLNFKKRQWDQKSEYNLKPGENIIEMWFRQSLGEQINNQVFRAWDAMQKQPLVAKANGVALDRSNGGTTGSEVLEENFGNARSLNYNIPVFSANELESVALNGLSNKVKRFITGEGLCSGMPELIPGKLVELKDFGELFSGLYYLSQVKHIVESDGFQTQITVERNSQ